MSTLYFKVAKSSSIGLKIQALIEIGEKVKTQVIEFADSIGANKELFCRSSWYIFYTGTVAFYFDEKPDMEVWKEFKHFDGYYSPRLSNKEGKFLQSKIDSFQKIRKEELHETFGYDSFIYSPGFVPGEGLFFGISIDTNANFKAPEDFEEITFTEYEKL